MLSATLLARTAACVLTVSVPAWAQTGPARTNTPSASRTAAGARTEARDATREAHDVTRLGGTTRFYRGSLASAAGLRRMSTDPAMSASMRRLLTDAGAADVSDALLTALGRVEENYVGVACMEARPEPGTVVECDVRPGESLEWMVFRPGGGAPAVVRNVRWAGRQPFRAYLVRVADRETSYTFLVPKDCGNLSLLSTQALAQPASVAEVA
uniref:hypothetical protein n=1 Tax=Luteitalea sp. TaxID=2004800 RepID=UPI0025B92999